MITSGSIVNIKWPGWQGTGEVLSVPSGGYQYYRVKHEDGRIGGFLVNQLAPVALAATVQIGRHGAPVLTLPKTLAVSTAKRIVLQLGRQQRYVTSDNVQKELTRLGFKSGDLGNAAGVLFKGGNFVRTSHTVKSQRPAARGRRIAVWEYVGAW